MADYSSYEGNGIFVQWQPEATTGTVSHYYLSTSQYLNGTFSGIASVAFPTDFYVDQGGKLDSFYIVEERDVSDNILATHQPLWGDELMLRASLAYELSWLLRVPVYRERLLFVDDARTKARITAWGSMNYFPRPRIYISTVQNDGDREPYQLIPQRGTTNLGTQIEFESDGFTWSGSQTAEYASFEWYADYNGYIYFVDSSGDPISVERADNVFIDYTFQAISPHEMNNAIYLAACEIIAQPGVDKSGRVNGPTDIGNLPRRWDAALVDGAAYRLLRRLALSLNQAERRLAFRDWQTENDDPAKRILDMAAPYGDRFKEEKELITKEEYPSTVLVIGQEYMLPGQRNRFFRMSFAASQ